MEQFMLQESFFRGKRVPGPLNEVCLNKNSNQVNKHVASFCRNSRLKGGVCILAKETVEIEAIASSEFSIEHFCQLASAEIKLFDQKVILLVAVYRVPGYRCEQFFDCISNFLNSKMKHSSFTLVIGDFNINLLGKELSSEYFIHIMSSFGLSYTINSYTREFKNSRTIIDSIFTNIDESHINSQRTFTSS